MTSPAVQPPAAEPGTPRSLRLLPDPLTPPADPKDRGPLCAPDEIAERVYNGHVSGRWVLANLPLELRVRVGRKVLFHLRDAERYRDALSADAERYLAGLSRRGVPR